MEASKEGYSENDKYTFVPVTLTRDEFDVEEIGTLEKTVVVFGGKEREPAEKKRKKKKTLSKTALSSLFRFILSLSFHQERSLESQLSGFVKRDRSVELPFSMWKKRHKSVHSKLLTYAYR